MALCYPGLKNNNPIFSVILTYRQEVRKSKNEMYVFLGDRKLSAAMKRLFRNQPLTAADKESIKKDYPLQYDKWIQYNKNSKVHLIKDVIRANETLYQVRKKIFRYISKPGKNLYILEGNQLIWVRTGKKEVGHKYRQIGYIYELLSYLPAPYVKKPVPNDLLVDADGIISTDYDLINQNRFLLRDLLDLEQSDNLFLYLYPLEFELNYLIENKVKLDERMIRGYIMLYWPEAKIDVKLKEVKSLYSKTLESLQREKYIHQLVTDTDIEKAPLGSCNLIAFKLVVNEGKDVPFIDLLKVFNYMKDRLTHEMPIVIYQDSDWIAPNIVVNKKAIENRSISQERLLDWSIDMTELRRTSNIKFKNYLNKVVVRLYDYTNVDHAGRQEDKYIVVIIRNTGMLEIFISYTETVKGSLPMVANAVKKVTDLIESLNKIDYRLNNKIPKDMKIEPPVIKYRSDRFYISPNTDLQNSNWFSFYDIKRDLESKDFDKMVKLFYPFVVPSVSTNPDFLTMKYKLISNFKNMTEIFENISEWKEEDRSDSWIVKKLRIEYGRTESQAMDILYQWKKGYRVRTDEGYIVKQGGKTIRFGLNRDKVSVSGINDINVLLDIYHFIAVFLHIYDNLDQYKKDKKFNKVWKDPLKYLIEEEEEEIVLDQSDLEFEDTEFDMNDFELEEVLTEWQDEQLDKIEEEIETEVVQDGDPLEAALKHTGKVDERYELQCEDADLIHDTCKDLCNDNNYYLRRLQRRDPNLYSYQTSVNYPESYARICQSGQQPIILDYDPDKRDDINKSAYTYSMRYASVPDKRFWYICPQAWCPTHEKPYPLSQIKNKMTRDTARLTNKCRVGKCPEGDHQVFWNDNEYIYPGFKKRKTPAGKCIPCCFKSNQTSRPFYKRCHGEEIEDMDVQDISYLIDYRESRILAYKRYGLLPEYVSKLFQCECPPGMMQKGTSCYLAKGIKDVPRRLSFLGAVADVISKDKDNTLTANQILKEIEKKLNKKLFKSLANGIVDIVFTDPDNPDLTGYANFKKFLKSKSEVINEKYLWDLVTRPGYITEEGFNLVIMTRDSLICPVGEYVDQFYDLNRPWVFMFNQSGLYQPIYHVRNDDGKFIQRGWFNPTKDAEVKRIYDILQENCMQRRLSMQSILRENEKEYGIKYDYDVKADANLIETVIHLEKLDRPGYKIKEQVMDKYNHVAGIILDNGLYLPVKPSGLLIQYPTTDRFKLMTYKDTLAHLRFLAGATPLNVAPKYKMINPDAENVNAVLTEAERVVPVKVTKGIPKDSLKKANWSFYPEADADISESIYFDDERKDIIARYTFEEESYQRIRLEVSKYLQSHKKIKQKIQEVIDNSKLSVSEKRNRIKDILNLIFRQTVTTTGKGVNLSDYVLPNQRIECAKQKSNCDDMHCKKHGDKCLVYIYPKNLITGKDNLVMYRSRLADELVRNLKLRDDILEDNIEYVVDRTIVDAPKGSLVLYGDTLLRDIGSFYKKRGEIYISPFVPFDRKEPSDLTLLYGDDNLFLNIENLSQYWLEILCTEYVVHNNNCGDQSLFCALADALNYMGEIAQEEVEQRAKKYTEKKLREILSCSIKELGIRFVRNLSAALGIELPDGLKSPNEGVLHLYNIVKGKNFRNFKSLQDYILSEEYPSDFIDAYILAENMKVNLCILEKYIRKRDMTFVDNGSEYFILLYVEQIKQRLTFSLIKRNKAAVFNRVELTTNFRNLLTDTANEEEDNKSSEHIEIKVEKS